MIISTNRVEAFSDGVIAIAITIMVLNIHLDLPYDPDADVSKVELLRFFRLLPHFLSYLLSFVILGIMWTNHHHMYHTIRHVDGKLLWHNLHLLFWLALVPFSTSLLGNRPVAPASTATYGFILFMSSLAFYLSRLYARRHGLFYVTKEKALNETLIRIRKRGHIKNFIGMGMYLISIPLSFVFVYATYVCFIVPAIISFIPEGVDSKSLSRFLFESFENDK